MKRFLTTVLTVILTIVLAAGAAAGFILYRKYKPSKEQVDQSEWYQASGNESAVFLNSEREEGVKGRYIDGQVYLPVDWVDEAVNERFYWDEENSQLIYTLPDRSCTPMKKPWEAAESRCWYSRTERSGCFPAW